MNNITKSLILSPMNMLYKVSPKLTLELLFKLKLGQKLNLKNPVTYNEKIQWIKLYDKNNLMPICADKYTVRSYIKDQGCEGILNNLLWVGFDPKEIPYKKLPEKFVIKVTHGSTFNIICTDKAKLNTKKVSKLLNKWLKAKFLPSYGEWFYGIEKPRIIVEKYLETTSNQPLLDYKIFCFNGVPKLVYVDTWKDGKHAINVYDTEFNLIPNVKLGYINDLETIIEKPKNFEKMLDYARKLSKPFLHVRVDFYNLEGEIVFGELTFTKSAGFGKITPHSFDVKMGGWLKLPSSKNSL